MIDKEITENDRRKEKMDHFCSDLQSYFVDSERRYHSTFIDIYLFSYT